MRPDIDSCFDDLSCGELYRQFYVVGDPNILIAVDESLIKIEHYCLFIYIVFNVP